jgi:hypothetical protein
VATEDGWQSAIHGSKEDKNSRMFDKDKRKVAMQRKTEVLSVKKELAG